MPLSDHEQRILAEIERRLLQEDPKFAQQVGSSSLRGHIARRMRWWAVGFVVGLAGFLAFLALVLKDWASDPAWVLLGAVCGFCLMVVSLFSFVRLSHRRSQAERQPSGGEAPASTPQPGRVSPGQGQPPAWWARMNERWQRRWEERGGPPS